MAANDYSESILQGIDIVVQKRLEELQFDRTIDGVINRVIDAVGGVYEIATATITFTAKGDQRYHKGDRVMVNIPQNDYTRTKTIIGYAANEGENNTVNYFVSPISRMIDVTGDLIGNGNYGLVATTGNSPSQIEIEASLPANTSGFSYLGLYGDFKTALSGYDIKTGIYGVKCQVKFTDENDSAQVADYDFNNTKFFGNRYSSIFSPQSVLLQLPNYKTIDSIKVYFYQDGNFSGGGYEPKGIENLFVENLGLSLGLPIEGAGERVLIYTPSNNTYSGESQKSLRLRWFTVEDGVATEQLTIPENVILRWYRYTGTTSDAYAGAGWQIFESSSDADPFSFSWNGEKYQYYNSTNVLANLTSNSSPMEITVSLAAQKATERYKALIFKEGAIYSSQEIEFTNDNVALTESQISQIDLSGYNTLSYVFNDGGMEGRYFFYGPGGSILDQTQINIPRTVEALLQGSKLSSDAYNYQWSLLGSNQQSSMIEITGGAETPVVTYRIRGYYNPSVGANTGLKFEIFDKQSDPNKQNALYSMIVPFYFGRDSGTDYTINLGLYRFKDNQYEPCQAVTIINSDGEYLEYNDNYYLIENENRYHREGDGTEQDPYYFEQDNGGDYLKIGEDYIEITNNVYIKQQGEYSYYIVPMIFNGEGTMVSFDSDGLKNLKISIPENATYISNKQVFTVASTHSFIRNGVPYYPLVRNNNVNWSWVDDYINTTSFIVTYTFSQTGVVTKTFPIAISKDDNYTMVGQTSILFDSAGYPPKAIAPFGLYGVTENGDAVTNIEIANELENFRQNNSGNYLKYSDNYYFISSKNRYNKIGSVYIQNDNGNYLQININNSIEYVVITSSNRYNPTENEYMPKVNNVVGQGNIKKRLTLPQIFVKDLKTIPCLVFDNGDEQSDDILWSQPIIMEMETHASTLLNEWDGSFTLDSERNAVLSKAVGAGRKEDDGSFSGVFLGDVKENADSSLSNTGVYGYYHGEQMYALMDNGRAFIGGAGRGRIEFDGQEGIIESGNYKPDSDTGLPIEGMQINLVDGAIRAATLNLQDKLAITADGQLYIDPSAIIGTYREHDLDNGTYEKTKENGLNLPIGTVIESKYAWAPSGSEPTGNYNWTLIPTDPTSIQVNYNLWQRTQFIFNRNVLNTVYTDLGGENYQNADIRKHIQIKDDGVHINGYNNKVPYTYYEQNNNGNYLYFEVNDEYYLITSDKRYRQEGRDYIQDDNGIWLKIDTQYYIEITPENRYNRFVNKNYREAVYGSDSIKFQAVQGNNTTTLSEWTQDEMSLKNLTRFSLNEKIKHQIEEEDGSYSIFFM